MWEVLAAPGSEHGKERLDLGLGSPLISAGVMLISEKVTVHLLFAKIMKKMRASLSVMHLMKSRLSSVPASLTFSLFLVL